MFHLKFKHTWHLKWNRSESMHWTFSKDSLNLRKQKCILFLWPYIFWNSSALGSLKKHTADAAYVMPQGRQPPETPVPTLPKDLFPFHTSPLWWSHIKAGGRKASRLQAAAIMGYPLLESREQQQPVTTALSSRLAWGHSSPRPTLGLPPPTSDSTERKAPLVSFGPWT